MLARRNMALCIFKASQLPFSYQFCRAQIYASVETLNDHSNVVLIVMFYLFTYEMMNKSGKNK